MQTLMWVRFYFTYEAFVMSTEIDALMTDDEVLDFTQLQRRKFIRAFTNNGEQLPTDAKDAKVFLSALSDMDRTAIGKKRIQSDERIAEMNAQVVDGIAAEVRRTMASYYAPADSDPSQSKTAPTLEGVSLPPLEVAEGETAIGVESESYSAFEKRYEERYGKPIRRED